MMERLRAKAPRLVIFDLGGTTARDGGEVASAFTAALRDGRVEFEPHELTSWRGASKREVVRRLALRQSPSPEAAEDLADRTYAAFRASLKASLSAVRDLSVPDAAPAFARLKAPGVRLALNSGFDREIVEIILSGPAWPADALDAVVCADDVRRGRPAPFMIFRSMERLGIEDVHDVAVVGDTALDLEAGYRAGVPWRVGVLGGAHDRATLEAAPYTHIVQSLSAVPAICLNGAA